MKEIKQELLTGERAKYNTHNAQFVDCTFADGESPLKESSDIELRNCLFKWQYPLWYCKNIKVFNTLFSTVKNFKVDKLVNIFLSAFEVYFLL